jgi:HutD
VCKEQQPRSAEPGWAVACREDRSRQRLPDHGLEEWRRLNDGDRRPASGRLAGRFRLAGQHGARPSDEPFSEFAGIDRTLAVVKGGGLSLTIGDTAPVVLDRNSEPMQFPGDAPTSARLIAGDIIDLNVMTRRGRFEHRLRRIREWASCDLDDYDIALAVACTGKVELSLSHEKNHTCRRRCRDPDTRRRRPARDRADRFGRLLSRLAARMPQSRGLRIAGPARLGIPTQHQAIVFESNRGETIEAKPLSQSRACWCASEGQERRLQAGNDLAWAT